MIETVAYFRQRFFSHVKSLLCCKRPSPMSSKDRLMNKGINRLKQDLNIAKLLSMY